MPIRETLDLFRDVTDRLLDAEQKQPVAPYLPSEEMYDRLDLVPGDDPVDPEDFRTALEELVLHTPRTATDAFFNQLFGGRNDKAVLGDLLAVLLNNSMYTYKAAGPMIGIEKAMLRLIIDRIGWGQEAEGTIATGGSMTNFMGLLMARDAAVDDMTRNGVREPLIIYTSEESHYSIPKNASFAGIGRDNVRYIPADDQGRMRTDRLRAAIEDDRANGLRPIMVNATAGTTVMGAFDPIAEIADICTEFGIWCHVDGAYCGSVLLSDQLRHLIDGVERVDSFTLNAHKMLGTPLTCSIIVVKDKNHLYQSFSNEASYLYQTHFDDFNPGKISLQCGRRNDALKLWTLWKQVGTRGLADMVEHQFHLGQVARDYIRDHDDYTLYSYDQSVSICFNYRDIPAAALCNALYEESEMMVGYGRFHGDEFVRFVTINAQNDEEDILRFFRTLERFADQHGDRLRATPEHTPASS